MRWPLWRVGVAESSMEPTLRPGDWLLVWRGAGPVWPLRIRPGQIVVAQHPKRPEMLLVKRVFRAADGRGWWLESDNRSVAAVDSRRFGAVPAEGIRGRVLLRYWRAGGAAARSPGAGRPG